MYTKTLLEIIKYLRKRKDIIDLRTANELKEYLRHHKITVDTYDDLEQIKESYNAIEDYLCGDGVLTMDLLSTVAGGGAEQIHTRKLIGEAHFGKASDFGTGLNPGSKLELLALDLAVPNHHELHDEHRHDLNQTLDLARPQEQVDLHRQITPDMLKTAKENLRHVDGLDKVVRPYEHERPIEQRRSEKILEPKLSEKRNGPYEKAHGQHETKTRSEIHQMADAHDKNFEPAAQRSHVDTEHLNIHEQSTEKNSHEVLETAGNSHTDSADRVVEGRTHADLRTKVRSLEEFHQVYDNADFGRELNLGSLERFRENIASLGDLGLKIDLRVNTVLRELDKAIKARQGFEKLAEDYKTEKGITREQLIDVATERIDNLAKGTLALIYSAAEGKPLELGIYEDLGIGLKGGDGGSGSPEGSPIESPNPSPAASPGAEMPVAELPGEKDVTAAFFGKDAQEHLSVRYEEDGNDVYFSIYDGEVLILNMDKESKIFRNYDLKILKESKKESLLTIIKKLKGIGVVLTDENAEKYLDNDLLLTSLLKREKSNLAFLQIKLDSILAKEDLNFDFTNLNAAKEELLTLIADNAEGEAFLQTALTKVANLDGMTVDALNAFINKINEKIANKTVEFIGLKSYVSDLQPESSLLNEGLKVAILNLHLREKKVEGNLKNALHCMSGLSEESFNSLHFSEDDTLNAQEKAKYEFYMAIIKARTTNKEKEKAIDHICNEEFTALIGKNAKDVKDAGRTAFVGNVERFSTEFIEEVFNALYEPERDAWGYFDLYKLVEGKDVLKRSDINKGTTTLWELRNYEGLLDKIQSEDFVTDEVFIENLRAFFKNFEDLPLVEAGELTNSKLISLQQIDYEKLLAAETEEKYREKEVEEINAILNAKSRTFEGKPDEPKYEVLIIDVSEEKARLEVYEITERGSEKITPIKKTEDKEAYLKYKEFEKWESFKKLWKEFSPRVDYSTLSEEKEMKELYIAYFNPEGVRKTNFDKLLGEDASSASSSPNSSEPEKLYPEVEPLRPEILSDPSRGSSPSPAIKLTFKDRVEQIERDHKQKIADKLTAAREAEVAKAKTFWGKEVSEGEAASISRDEIAGRYGYLWGIEKIVLGFKLDIPKDLEVNLKNDRAVIEQLQNDGGRSTALEKLVSLARDKKFSDDDFERIQALGGKSEALELERGTLKLLPKILGNNLPREVMSLIAKAKDESIDDPSFGKIINILKILGRKELNSWERADLLSVADIIEGSAPTALRVLIEIAKNNDIDDDTFNTIKNILSGSVGEDQQISEVALAYLTTACETIASRVSSEQILSTGMFNGTNDKKPLETAIYDADGKISPKGLIEFLRVEGDGKEITIQDISLESIGTLSECHLKTLLTAIKNRLGDDYAKRAIDIVKKILDPKNVTTTISRFLKRTKTTINNGDLLKVLGSELVVMISACERPLAVLPRQDEPQIDLFKEMQKATIDYICGILSVRPDTGDENLNTTINSYYGLLQTFCPEISKCEKLKLNAFRFDDDKNSEFRGLLVEEIFPQLRDNFAWLKERGVDVWVGFKETKLGYNYTPLFYVRDGKQNDDKIYGGMEAGYFVTTQELKTYWVEGKRGESKKERIEEIRKKYYTYESTATEYSYFFKGAEILLQKNDPEPPASWEDKFKTAMEKVRQLENITQPVKTAEDADPKSKAESKADPEVAKTEKADTTGVAADETKTKKAVKTPEIMRGEIYIAKLKKNYTKDESIDINDIAYLELFAENFVGYLVNQYKVNFLNSVNLILEKLNSIISLANKHGVQVYNLEALKEVVQDRISFLERERFIAAIEKNPSHPLNSLLILKGYKWFSENFVIREEQINGVKTPIYYQRFTTNTADFVGYMEEETKGATTGNIVGLTSDERQKLAMFREYVRAIDGREKLQLYVKTDVTKDEKGKEKKAIKVVFVEEGKKEPVVFSQQTAIETNIEVKTWTVIDWSQITEITDRKAFVEDGDNFRPGVTQNTFYGALLSRHFSEVKRNYFNGKVYRLLQIYAIAHCNEPKENEGTKISAPGATEPDPLKAVETLFDGAKKDKADTDRAQIVITNKNALQALKGELRVDAVLPAVEFFYKNRTLVGDEVKFELTEIRRIAESLPENDHLTKLIENINEILKTLKQPTPSNSTISSPSESPKPSEPVEETQHHGTFYDTRGNLLPEFANKTVEDLVSVFLKANVQQSEEAIDLSKENDLPADLKKVTSDQFTAMMALRDAANSATTETIKDVLRTLYEWHKKETVIKTTKEFIRQLLHNALSRLYCTDFELVKGKIEAKGDEKEWQNFILNPDYGIRVSVTDSEVLVSLLDVSGLKKESEVKYRTLLGKYMEKIIKLKLVDDKFFHRNEISNPSQIASLAKNRDYITEEQRVSAVALLDTGDLKAAEVVEAKLTAKEREEAINAIEKFVISMSSANDDKAREAKINDVGEKINSYRDALEGVGVNAQSERKSLQLDGPIETSLDTLGFRQGKRTRDTEDLKEKIEADVTAAAISLATAIREMIHGKDEQKVTLERVHISKESDDAIREMIHGKDEQKVTLERAHKELDDAIHEFSRNLLKEILTGIGKLDTKYVTETDLSVLQVAVEGRAIPTTHKLIADGDLKTLDFLIENIANDRNCSYSYSDRLYYYYNSGLAGHINLEHEFLMRVLDEHINDDDFWNSENIGNLIKVINEFDWNAKCPISRDGVINLISELAKLPNEGRKLRISETKIALANDGTDEGAAESLRLVWDYLNVVRKDNVISYNVYMDYKALLERVIKEHPGVGSLTLVEGQTFKDILEEKLQEIFPNEEDRKTPADRLGNLEQAVKGAKEAARKAEEEAKAAKEAAGKAKEAAETAKKGIEALTDEKERVKKIQEAGEKEGLAESKAKEAEAKAEAKAKVEAKVAEEEKVLNDFKENLRQYERIKARIESIFAEGGHAIPQEIVELNRVSGREAKFDDEVPSDYGNAITFLNFAEKIYGDTGWLINIKSLKQCAWTIDYLRTHKKVQLSGKLTKEAVIEALQVEEQRLIGDIISTSKKIKSIKELGNIEHILSYMEGHPNFRRETRRSEINKLKLQRVQLLVERDNWLDELTLTNIENIVDTFGLLQTEGIKIGEETLTLEKFRNQVEDRLKEIIEDALYIQDEVNAGANGRYANLPDAARRQLEVQANVTLKDALDLMKKLNKTKTFWERKNLGKEVYHFGKGKTITGEELNKKLRQTGKIDRREKFDPNTTSWDAYVAYEGTTIDIRMNSMLYDHVIDEKAARESLTVEIARKSSSYEIGFGGTSKSDIAIELDANTQTKLNEYRADGHEINEHTVLRNLNARLREEKDPTERFKLEYLIKLLTEKDCIILESNDGWLIISDGNAIEIKEKTIDFMYGHSKVMLEQFIKFTYCRDIQRQFFNNFKWWQKIRYGNELMGTTNKLYKSDISVERQINLTYDIGKSKTNFNFNEQEIITQFNRFVNLIQGERGLKVIGDNSSIVLQDSERDKKITSVEQFKFLQLIKYNPTFKHMASERLSEDEIRKLELAANFLQSEFDNGYLVPDLLYMVSEVAEKLGQSDVGTPVRKIMEDAVSYRPGERRFTNASAWYNSGLKMLDKPKKDSATVRDYQLLQFLAVSCDGKDEVKGVNPILNLLGISPMGEKKALKAKEQHIDDARVFILNRPNSEIIASALKNLPAVLKSIFCGEVIERQGEGQETEHKIREFDIFNDKKLHLGFCDVISKRVSLILRSYKGEELKTKEEIKKYKNAIQSVFKKLDSNFKKTLITEYQRWYKSIREKNSKLPELKLEEKWSDDDRLWYIFEKILDAGNSCEKDRFHGYGEDMELIEKALYTQLSISMAEEITKKLLTYGAVQSAKEKLEDDDYMDGLKSLIISALNTPVYSKEEFETEKYEDINYRLYQIVEKRILKVFYPGEKYPRLLYDPIITERVLKTCNLSDVGPISIGGNTIEGKMGTCQAVSIISKFAYYLTRLGIIESRDEAESKFRKMQPYLNSFAKLAVYISKTLGKDSSKVEEYKRFALVANLLYRMRAGINGEPITLRENEQFSPDSKIVEKKSSGTGIFAVPSYAKTEGCRPDWLKEGKIPRVTA